MVDQSSSKWRMHRGPYLGEVSALCFLQLPSHLFSLPLLLAGMGSEILIYDLELGKMIRSFTVFDGIRVHGITSSVVRSTQKDSTTKFASEIAVYGERKVKVFSFSFDTVSGCPNTSTSPPRLSLIHLLPKFSHWVLDVCFLMGYLTSSNVGSPCLAAIGCSDNSVHIWDFFKSFTVLKVQSPVRCLLYSMRMWGDNLEVLRIASGTIYNEIIVWKVGPKHCTSYLTSVAEDQDYQSMSFSNCCQLTNQQYDVILVCKLVGHEGSIFRLAWSSCGSKLVSVSDDRSVRVWAVPIRKEDFLGHDPVALVLFGHNARVWDCSIFDSLIVTASEDCTCRIWGIDGEQLQIIREHVGRGIWRCLYDPNSSLIITAGFDSAIKVHKPHASLSMGLVAVKENPGQTEMFTICFPNELEQIGLMDSKSEYVRCLRFACEDSLYVATNHGYLYHAKLCGAGDAQWTQLVQVSNGTPIICMDLLSKDSFELDCGAEDWIAVGDGKGNMTVIGVNNDDCTPTVRSIFTWSAEMERQLLGTHWCKSLGCRYIFTADPRGTLKLWRLPDCSQANLLSSMRSYNVSHIAAFMSNYGIRIMCLDACIEEEVLVCGDLRGNMVLFPLEKRLVLDMPITQEVKISPVNHFKGVHGISSVSSVSMTVLTNNQIEIRSTGADGCICYLEYDRSLQNLQFTGMKQVKELSLIEYASIDNNYVDTLSRSYAAGFASVDFIVWNLISETKILKVPCGGWRRPHSYYLGDIPEMKNCFAFVKDEMIYIHKHWIHDRDQKIYPQSLNMQFHGREMHSLCFIFEDMHLGINYNHNLVSNSSLIATGCEDGTVRMTWYSPGIENWSMSKLVGEHVGGSAVRSICCVSKLHVISSYATNLCDGRGEVNAATEDKDNPILLISVGAKRVLTSWILKSKRLDNKKDIEVDHQYNSKGDDTQLLSSLSSSITFQWLSTDMPAKYASTHKYPENDAKKVVEGVEALSERGMDFTRDKHEDDWRYLAVTAFHVKCAGSRISVCFVVVACSDATLTLRALILPFRLWFDVAMLVPLSAPVLSLQHIIFPICKPSKDNIQVGSIYIVISGSTDGSVAFWDLTDSVEAFIQRVSVLNIEKFFDCQKRPRTGRGSQGGRWWRSLSSSVPKKRQDSSLVSSKAKDETNNTNCALHAISSSPNDFENSKMTCSQSMHDSETNKDNFSLEICEIQPLHLLREIHQSGVNCLHVSEMKCDQNTDSCRVYNIISGGDDQALHNLLVELSFNSTNSGEMTNLVSKPEYQKGIYCHSRSMKYKIRFLYFDKIPSAHSSAVKGVWTDGSWVFSTGLDQRIRCWHLQENKLTEQAHIVVSVPEPEALSAKTCGRNLYQIAVAGRGMQIVEFSAF